MICQVTELGDDFVILCESQTDISGHCNNTTDWLSDSPISYTPD